MGPVLVARHVVVHAQQVALRPVGGQGVEQAARGLLVGAALAGYHLAGVVVPEADVVRDGDAAGQRRGQGGHEAGGVEVGGLDEDGAPGAADERQPGRVLGHVDVGRARSPVRRAADERHGHGVRGRGRDVRRHLLPGGYVWPRGRHRFPRRQVELPVRGLQAGLVQLGGVAGLHAPHLAFQRVVVMRTLGGVLR